MRNLPVIALCLCLLSPFACEGQSRRTTTPASIRMEMRQGAYIDHKIELWRKDIKSFRKGVISCSIPMRVSFTWEPSSASPDPSRTGKVSAVRSNATNQAGRCRSIRSVLGNAGRGMVKDFSSVLTGTAAKPSGNGTSSAGIFRRNSRPKKKSYWIRKSRIWNSPLSASLFPNF